MWRGVSKRLWPKNRGAAGRLNAQDLHDFKESDGILAPGVTFSEAALRLRATAGSED